MRIIFRLSIHRSYIILLLLSLSFLSINAQDCVNTGFDVSLWKEFSILNGAVDKANVPVSITIKGTAAGTMNQTAINYCFTVPEDGTIQFDYQYTSGNMAAGWDPFLISINGVETTVLKGEIGVVDGTGKILTPATGATTQMDFFSIAVSSGDFFCFSQKSIDDMMEAAQTIITNFSYPVQCPTDKLNSATSASNQKSAKN